MGSDGKLAKRALLTDTPVMVQVVNFPSFLEMGSLFLLILFAFGLILLIYLFSERNYI